MIFSASFIKTNKSAGQLDSINATLLTKSGFVEQTMAGVYTFLPLGWRVLNKIENIIRQEMDKVGAEMLMSALAPRSLWEITKRQGMDVLFEADGANEASRQRNDAKYILNPTHEEVITPIAQKIKPSYRDLPFAIYQIQTKFRNEARPKSGLLRGREFRMKDLYSFHTDDEDRQKFYEGVKTLYVNIFERLGLGDDTVIALASGGDFTEDYSHEFQTKCETGEDTIYFDQEEGVYYNQEVATKELINESEPIKACEVGNIFPLGTKFSEAFDYNYTDKAGKRCPVYMASYGIGSSRVMGVLAEKFNDDRGLIWPGSVAPYTVHLVGLNQEEHDVRQSAMDVYHNLLEAGVEVILDNRDNVTPGEKMADADLIGCPWRAVVSRRTNGEVELKARSAEESQLISTSHLIECVSKNV